MSKDTDKPSKPRAKPHKRLRRLVKWLILFAALGMAVNGPIARRVVLYKLNQELMAQGMSGQAHISGSISSGFAITEFSYSGDAGLQSLQIDRLSIDYRLLELLDSKIRKILLTNGRVVIDIAKFPDSEKSEAPTDSKETLRLLHPWVSQPAIEISKLDITLLNQEEKQARIILHQLNHQADTDVFDLQNLLVSDRTGQSTPTQNVQFVWQLDSLKLDRLEVLPDIALEKVALDWKNDLQAEAELRFLAARLKLNLSDTLHVSLSDGSIDSLELVKRFKLDLPAAFVVSGLESRIDGWQGHSQMADWNIQTTLQLSSASYQDHQLSDTTLKLKQQKQSYSLQLDGGLDTNQIHISLDGKWLAPASEQWWASTEADYEIDVPKLGTLVKFWPNPPTQLDLTKTSIQLKGRVRLENEQLLQLNSTGTIQGMVADKTLLPSLSVHANYQHQGRSSASISSKPQGVIDLHADYDPVHKTYQGHLKINERNPAWINSLAHVFEAGVVLDGPVDFKWSGSGSTSDFQDLDQAHQGKLAVEKLKLKLPETPAIEIATQLSYHWPENVQFQSLSVREDDWHASAEIRWDGKRIETTATRLTRGDELIASLSGSLPYQKNIRSTQTFFEQQLPWNLTVKTQPIALKKLREWFGIDRLNTLTGSTKLDIELSGSPKKPEIKGQAEASKLKGLNDQQLLPLNVAFDFYSKDRKLIFNAKMLENKDERIVAKGAIPFTPSDWLKNPDWMKRFVSHAPVSAEVKINKLTLGRFEKFIPELKKISGSISGDALVSGTIEKPLYTLDLNADVPLVEIPSSEIGDIRNIKLTARMDQTQNMTTKLTAVINGGKFEVNGNVDLADFSKPVFDLTLKTNYALIHRDDLVSVRANANLRLTGAMDDATIGGTIGIVESLFYKDIELIPIGVPSSAVAEVKLPALSAAKAENGLPVPAPFSGWKLDLTLRTDDPVLIRGNVASGNLSGSLKIGGTLGNPMPKGTIFANRVKAKLPFSILNIERGQIIFNGRDGLNPTLKITGKSTVGAYAVNMFVYGPATSPKTTFTSFPPLPESEVMSLLATGSTTSSLENQSVAALKAFQLFLLKLKQRNNKPDGNKLFHSLLAGVEDLNLNVGEVDPFTGRKFTSSTVELHPHWHLSAQVDDSQQTRGLIVYVIRFR